MRAAGARLAPMVKKCQNRFWRSAALYGASTILDVFGTSGRTHVHRDGSAADKHGLARDFRVIGSDFSIALSRTSP